MRVIKPYYEIMDDIDGQAILKKIEYCARVSHKSGGRITETSAAPFVKKIIELGDESVLEHVSITVRFVCDRGVSHGVGKAQNRCNYARIHTLCKLFARQVWKRNHCDSAVLSA